MPPNSASSRRLARPRRRRLIGMGHSPLCPYRGSDRGAIIGIYKPEGSHAMPQEFTIEEDQSPQQTPPIVTGMLIFFYLTSVGTVLLLLALAIPQTTDGDFAYLLPAGVLLALYAGFPLYNWRR